MINKKKIEADDYYVKLEEAVLALADVSNRRRRYVSIGRTQRNRLALSDTFAVREAAVKAARPKILVAVSNGRQKHSGVVLNEPFAKSPAVKAAKKSAKRKQTAKKSTAREAVSVTFYE